MKTFVQLIVGLVDHTKLATLQNLLGYDYKTLEKFVKAFQNKAPSIWLLFSPKIGGKWVVVEVDESKFGKRK